MSVATQRNLANLRQECEALGLKVVSSGKREAKEDYVSALAEYHLAQRGGITPGMKYRLGIKSFQLCYNSSNLEPRHLENILNSEYYAAEEKLNGARLLIYYDPSRGFETYGRNISVADYLPTCYTDNMWWGRTAKEVYMSGIPFGPFVLDCEVEAENPNINTQTFNRKTGVVTETALQATSALLAINPEESVKIQREQGGMNVFPFDCLMVKGKSIMRWPYYKRKALTEKIIQHLQGLGLPFKSVPAIVKNKKAFLHRIWARGGEGIILKPLNGIYTPTSSRPRDGWVKVKRTVSGALGDTVDGFITGFEPGDPKRGFAHLVGAIHVSCYLTPGNRKHLVARCANLELELREQMTIYPEGDKTRPHLKSEYLNMVVEVEGQSVSARSLRLTHPRLIRFRDDKSPKDCQYSEEALRKLVL